METLIKASERRDHPDIVDKHLAHKFGQYLVNVSQDTEDVTERGTESGLTFSGEIDSGAEDVVPALLKGLEASAEGQEDGIAAKPEKERKKKAQEKEKEQK